MAATKTTTLLDLAQKFDKYMFGCYAVPKSPIAKGFTVNGGKQLYWEVLDVQPDGTYPCAALHTSSITYFDQNCKVIIHHIDNPIKIIAMAAITEGWVCDCGKVNINKIGHTQRRIAH